LIHKYNPLIHKYNSLVVESPIEPSPQLQHASGGRNANKEFTSTAAFKAVEEAYSHMVQELGGEGRADTAGTADKADTALGLGDVLSLFTDWRRTPEWNGDYSNPKSVGKVSGSVVAVLVLSIVGSKCKN
jgi:hypothetical protein